MFGANALTLVIRESSVIGVRVSKTTQGYFSLVLVSTTRIGGWFSSGMDRGDVGESYRWGRRLGLYVHFPRKLSVGKPNVFLSSPKVFPLHACRSTLEMVMPGKYM